MRGHFWASLAVLLLASAAAAAGEPGGRLETAAESSRPAATFEPYVVSRSAIRLPVAPPGRFGQLSYRFFESLRLEAGTSRQPAGAATADFMRAGGFDALTADELGAGPEDVSAAIRLIHDVDTGGRIRPYVLGGVGATRLARPAGTPERALALGERLLFDYQLGAGLGYRLNERVHVTAGYRYIGDLGAIAPFDRPRDRDSAIPHSDHVFGFSVRIPFGPAR